MYLSAAAMLEIGTSASILMSMELEDVRNAKHLENQESIHLHLTNVQQQKDTKMNVSILMKRANPTRKIN